MSIAERPLVSVVIPVYNGSRYFLETLESVLSQTYRRVEVIVVDDGSTDGSGEVARRFAPVVRYVYQPHAGIGAARNRGLEEAGGAMLVFCDADDVMVRDRLELQVGALEENPDVDIVYARMDEFLSPDIESVPGIRSPVQGAVMRSVNTMLIRREAFIRAGLYSTELTSSVELDWRMRAVEAGLRDVLLDQVVQRRRLHGGNSSVLLRSDAERLQALKAALDRRRSVAPASSEDH
jgi:glycosyltransferase involved in cell wall biosynthesis